MFDVERSIVVVRPAKPYLDWVHSLDEEGKQVTLKDLRADCTAYLIPEVVDDAGTSETVETFYNEIFEQELRAWMEDESIWPVDRDLKTFLEWFELEFCSVVIDLCD